MTVFKGWNAQIYFGTISPYSQIGYADSASVEVSTNMEPFYAIGSRQSVQIVEGNEEVTGSFSRAWIDIGYLSLLAPGNVALTEFDLVFQIGANGPKVYCYDCKFERGALDIPQDGILKEDYDFQAARVAVVA